MANTGFKGVDVRQTGNQLVFRVFLQNTSGTILTTGTTSLYLYELQSDGTISSYDFSSNTFKTTALTTETASMSHRTGNNSSTNTGIWTYALSTLTGFTNGSIYLAKASNSTAVPNDQVREFQYGSAEGDLTVTSTGYIKSDPEEWKGTTIATPDTNGYPKTTIKSGTGTGEVSLSSGLVSLSTTEDVYLARISFTKDQSNTTDEYTVTWFKNAIVQTSGITSPTIQVVKRSDGTDLIASTAMTQIGTTGSYKYDATTTARQTSGQAYLVISTASINSSTRTFAEIVGRDS